MTAPASRLLLPAVGFTLWSVAFVLIYASQSFGCAFAWDEVRLAGPLSLQRAQLVALFLVATAASALAAWALRPERDGTGPRGPAGRPPPATFLRSIGFATALAALGATLATFAPVVMLTACA